MAERKRLIGVALGVFLVYFCNYNVIVVHALPTGAPVVSNPEVCTTMTPGHFLPASGSPSPYSISVGSIYIPAQPLTVTINTNPGDGRFKGIFLLARRSITNEIIGSWSVTDPTNFQTTSCGQNNSAVTHQNNTDKASTTTFIWTPPNFTNGDVCIAATFVRRYDTFWVNVTSSLIQALDLCAGNQCQNGGACQPSTGTNPPYVCVCPSGFTGQFCQTSLTTTAPEPCLSNPCLNGGTCVQVFSVYYCECANGFQGNNCELQSTDLCTNNQCQNGGACNPAPGSSFPYTCTCPVGYTGQLCQTALDLCANNLCQNGGTCNPFQGSTPPYFCDCPSGYTGQYCQTGSTDLCANNLCQNGGACYPFPGSTPPYFCNCPSGFIGQYCQTALDLCANNLCQNGGTCNPFPGSTPPYFCNCPSGYTGQYCQTGSTDLCANNLCQNGGACNPFPGSIPPYLCSCPSGFSGQYCQTELSSTTTTTAGSAETTPDTSRPEAATSGITLVQVAAIASGLAVAILVTAVVLIVVCVQLQQGSGKKENPPQHVQMTSQLYNSNEQPVLDLEMQEIAISGVDDHYVMS